MNDAEVNRIRVTDVTNIWDWFQISYILRFKINASIFDSFLYLAKNFTSKE